MLLRDTVILVTGAGRGVRRVFPLLRSGELLTWDPA